MYIIKKIYKYKPVLRVHLEKIGEHASRKNLINSSLRMGRVLGPNKTRMSSNEWNQFGAGSEE